MERIKNLILIGLVLIGAAMPSFAGPSGFNAMYWVTGEVTLIPHADADKQPSASVPLESRRIIFYKDLPGGIVETRAFNVVGDMNGSYALNIYDSDGIQIIPSDTDIYKVAVANDPIDNYGADGVDVTVTGNGFEVRNLSIEWGKGPPLPLEGAVQLFIARDGNDIKISWDTGTYGTDPVIYGMFNNLDGTGQYNNNVYTGAHINPNWIDVADPAYINEFDLTQKASGHIKHLNMVSDVQGNNRPEVYYKAVKSGYNLDTETNGHNILESAWAVGKVDTTVTGGGKLSAISIPFLNLSTDINTLIGNQAGYPGGTGAQDAVLITSWGGGAWNKVSYFRDPDWVNISPQPAVYDGDKGLLIKTRTNDTDKKITLTGNVKLLNTATEYLITQNLNLLSFPYPKQMRLSLINLDVGAKSDDVNTADLICGWEGNSWGTVSMLTSAGWVNVSPIGVDLLNTAKPVLYLSRSSAQLNWSINPNLLGYQ